MRIIGGWLKEQVWRSFIGKGASNNSMFFFEGTDNNLCRLAIFLGALWKVNICKELRIFYESAFKLPKISKFCFKRFNYGRNSALLLEQQHGRKEEYREVLIYLI